MKTDNDNVVERPVESRDDYALKLPIILSFYSILHVAMMVTGFIYQDDCPVEHHIPLFLILLGIFGLFSRIVGSIKYFLKSIKDLFFIFFVFSSLLYVGELIIFILGAFWVYKEAIPSFDPEDENQYCHEGTYLFAFCYVTIMLSLVIFATIFLCCVLLLASPFGIHKMAGTKPWQIVII